MDWIEIVVCIDKWFVMPTGVMMYSVCVNNPDIGIRFHVIVDDSVPESGKDDLRKMVDKFSGKDIVFYNIDITCFPSFPINTAHLSQASYYRLMLSEILDGDLHKVLYLDGDTIVRHSLLPLWNVDVRDVAIAAVSDVSECDIRRFNILHYSMSLGYFNSGVMLINLDYWRDNNVAKDFYDYVKNYPDRLRFHDQDVLNYFFRHKKRELPIKYNLQREHLIKYKYPFYDYWKREKEVLEARRDPVIVHFTSLDKPWNRELLYQAHPFSSTFFKYQEQTEWKGHRTDKRSGKQHVKDFVGELLRCVGIRHPQKRRVSIFVDLEPID